MDITQPSIVDIPEDQLVEEFLRYPHLQKILFGLLGNTNVVGVFSRVPGKQICPTCRSVAGDVDILVVTNLNGAKTIAFEIKRIKIGRDAFATGLPNKLRKIRKAVHQANALEVMGFDRVYLAFLVVIDGRERTEYNFAFRGVDDDLQATLDNSFELKGLHQDVGVICFEIVQPIDRDFTLSGAIATKVFRIASSRRQPDKLTIGIRDYINTGIS